MRQLLCAIVLVASCAAPEAPAMRRAAGPCRACSKDAIVVFVRPSRQSLATVELREQDGTFLGRLEGETWVAVPLAAGRHLIIATAPDRMNTRPAGLVAMLEAGRLYHVEVELPQSYPILYAAGPSRVGWARLLASRRSFPRLEPDPQRIAPPPASWGRVVAYVRSWWTALDPRDQYDRTVAAQDGLAPDATLADTTAAGVACAALPAEARLAEAAVEDRDVVRCWTEMPTGSHIPVRICKTPRELDEMHDATKRVLINAYGAPKPQDPIHQ